MVALEVGKIPRAPNMEQNIPTHWSFPSSPQPPFQSESKSSVFVMAIRSTLKWMRNDIHNRLPTKTYFENEAELHSEMTYSNP